MPAPSALPAAVRTYGARGLEGRAGTNGIEPEDLLLGFQLACGGGQERVRSELIEAASVDQLYDALNHERTLSIMGKARLSDWSIPDKCDRRQCIEPAPYSRKSGGERIAISPREPRGRYRQYADSRLRPRSSTAPPLGEAQPGTCEGPRRTPHMRPTCRRRCRPTRIIGCL